MTNLKLLNINGKKFYIICQAAWEQFDQQNQID